MKLSNLLIFSLIVAPTVVSAKGRRALKATKGYRPIDRKCRDFERIFTEPSVTDIGKPDCDDPLLFVWQDNNLCKGEFNPYDSDGNFVESRCEKVGTASGTCTILVDGDQCDSVDTWDIFDRVDGDFIGTISSRGIAFKPGLSIVLGGTDCFENAGGTIKSSVFFEGPEDSEYWFYDLTNVQLK